MTGFGSATTALGDGEVLVELRAINHRHVEVRTTMSPDLVPYTHQAEQALRKAVSRGRYDLRVATAGTTPTVMTLDVDAAKEMYGAMLALRDELDTAGDVSLAAAIQLLPQPLRSPGVVPEVAGVVVATVQLAVVALDEMREREGSHLGQDLRACVARIRALQQEIRTRIPETVAHHRDRLTDRVSQLLAQSDVTVDGGRLEMEVALLADRTDVSEELVRIESHLEQIETLLGTDGAIGRKLDFLLQELNREANTLSAKAQNAAVTQLGVDVKAEVERMRQQTANVI